MDKLDRLQQINKNFQVDRPTMHSRDSEMEILAISILGETMELLEAIKEGSDKDVATELADVGLYVLTAFNVMGMNAYDEMREKVARNIVKYPAKYFTNGLTYDEGAKRAKTEWIDIKGEDEFYQ